jgi:(p)ppGpp synthase/HD superfamily hydrolase
MKQQHQETAKYVRNLCIRHQLWYGNLAYAVHLQDVYNVLLPLFGDNDVVMKAALCHDLLEDTPITYNDLRSQVGEATADVVYDVTNELGKNRTERAERTYPKIAANPLAVIVKVADRIANTRYSQSQGSSMYRKYCAEYPKFRNALYNANHVNQYPALSELWAILDQISRPV